MWKPDNYQTKYNVYISVYSEYCIYLVLAIL